jgi:hypothetical protein
MAKVCILANNMPASVERYIAVCRSVNEMRRLTGRILYYGALRSSWERLTTDEKQMVILILRDLRLS